MDRSSLFLLGGKQLVVPLLAHLRAVQRATGESYHRVFENISPRFGFLEKFERKVRVSTSDQDAAIEKAEAVRSSKECALLRIPCHVHICSAILKKAGKILDMDITGMVQLTLSLNETGAMTSFRKALRDTLARPGKLVVRTGLPPRAISDANRQLLDILFEGCDSYEQARRCTIESLANGDWTKDGVIETWVREPVAQQDMVHRLQTAWVTAVCGAAPHVYPRHRWTGAEITMRWVLLLHCRNGILAEVYTGWAGGLPQPELSDPPEGCGLAHPPDRRIDAEPAAAEAAPEGQIDVDGSQDRPALDVMQVNREAANLSGDPISAYKQEVSSWRRNAIQWLNSDGSASRLLIFRRVQEGQRRLMKEHLVAGGSSWERKQAWKELRAAIGEKYGYTAREYRIAVAADGRFDMSVCLFCQRVYILCQWRQQPLRESSSPLQ